MYEGSSASVVGGLAPDIWTGAGSRRQRLPGGFDELAAGAELATAVSAIDPQRLQGRDLVPMLEAIERVISHYQTLKYRVISHLDEVFDGDSQLTAAEVATALHLTRAASETETLLASGLRCHPQIASGVSVK